RRGRGSTKSETEFRFHFFVDFSLTAAITDSTPPYISPSAERCMSRDLRGLSIVGPLFWLMATRAVFQEEIGRQPFYEFCASEPTECKPWLAEVPRKIVQQVRMASQKGDISARTTLQSQRTMD